MGRVGLVTGGSRGIGRAIAKRLAAEGAAVSICGRSADTLERTLHELRSHGVLTHAVVADVTCPGEVERFVEESAAALMFPGGGWERFRAEQLERFAEFERREFPCGWLGTPEEVADVVAFLLSERAAWINGANIPVDGAQGRPSAF